MCLSLLTQLDNIGISGSDPFLNEVDQATMLPERTSSVGATEHIVRTLPMLYTAQNRVLQLGFPIPLCPFPDMEHSSSLSVTPPAAGLGFLVCSGRSS